MSTAPQVIWLVCGLITLGTLFGCQKQEPIRRYTVTKPPAPTRPTGGDNPHAGLGIPAPSEGKSAPPLGDPTDRTLGAILPTSPQGWFFKLTGPAAAVAAQQATFDALIKTLKFADGKPQWTLPEGWQERPGNQIRYATLVIPGEGKPLEVSVTALPNNVEPSEYVLVNVNRWRGQLKLPPIAQADLAAQSTEVKLEGATATIVNLLGHASPSGMGNAPFMSGARDGN